MGAGLGVRIVAGLLASMQRGAYDRPPTLILGGTTDDDTGER
jgi:hypothetical protein